VEVEFSLTAEDYKAWVAFHKRNRPASRKPAPGLHRTGQPRPRGKLGRWLFLVLVAVWAALFATSPSTTFHEFLGYGLAALVGAIVGGLAILFLLAWARVVEIRSTNELVEDPRNRWLVGPRRLRISPEGIHVSGEYTRSFITWPTVWFIGATDEHIFLYIATTQAHIVPRQAFADRSDFEAFLTLAARYRDNYASPAPQRSTGITTIPTVLPIPDIESEPT
jgi:hypothetical protein